MCYWIPNGTLLPNTYNEGIVYFIKNEVNLEQNYYWGLQSRIIYILRYGYSKTHDRQHDAVDPLPIKYEINQTLAFQVLEEKVYKTSWVKYFFQGEFIWSITTLCCHGFHYLTALNNWHNWRNKYVGILINLHYTRSLRRLTVMTFYSRNKKDF